MNEMPSVCNDKTRKARKDHKCSNCGESITKYSNYHYISGIWNGYPNGFKLCNNCYSVISNFREMDKDISYEDGPDLGRHGISCWLQGFLCVGYQGKEAAEDMAKRLKVPVSYIEKLI